MSYTKPCNKCGERISLRQMPQGQWVAFDVSTEESHVCGVKNDPDISIKLRSKKRKKLEEDESIDLGYEDDVLETKKVIEESKTYSNSSGVNYCIDKAIIDKKRILIDYYSDFNKENTYREISPIKKFKSKSKNYLQAYCHLRKAARNFLTRSIKTATEMDKKRTTAKISEPDLNFILNSDEELDEIKSVPKKEIKVNKLNKETRVKKEVLSVKKKNKVEKKIKHEENDIPSSGPGFWVYMVFMIVFMGLVRGLLIPLFD